MEDKTLANSELGVPILSAKCVYKKYKGSTSYANENVSLTINRGEIMGLLGPNGAGKTTFVRQACGLLKPDSGLICINGIDINSQKNYPATVISYLGQIAYTHRALKVIEFISYTGIYRGVSRKESLSQAEYYLNYFDMQTIRNRLIEHLSGGESRIVAFIAAILGGKPLIILDEPTNDVDPEKRIKLWELVKELRREHGISFLLVTHNIHEAQDVVDRVTIMQSGKIIKVGNPVDLADALDIGTKIDFTIPYDLSLSLLDSYSNVIKLDNEHYRVFTPKDRIAVVLSDILNSTVGRYIKDVKIVPPSLEDIYMDNIRGE